MEKSKNPSQTEEFNQTIQNIISLKGTDNKNQTKEMFSQVLGEIEHQLEQILMKKVKFNPQSYIKMMCNQIIALLNSPNKNFLISKNNFDSFNKTLNILSQAQKIQYIEYNSDLTPFFIHCCFITLNESKDTYGYKKCMENFFNPLFTDDHFSFKYFNHSLYQTFFIDFLPKCGNIYFLDWILNMIINFPNINSFKNIDCDSIFQYIQKIYQGYELNQEVSELFLLSIAKLFSRMVQVNPNCTQSFLDNNIPQIFDDHIKTEEKWKEAFTILLSSNSSVDIPAPNEGIFNFLFNFLLSTNFKIQEIQNKKEKEEFKKHSIFKQYFIFKNMEKYGCDQCIEKYFPEIQKLLDFLSEIIDDVISLNFTELFTNLLQNTFRIFSSQMIDDHLQYSQLISIIEKYNINFDQYPSKYIKCFLRTPSPSTLNILFNNDYFLESSLHYFSLPIVKESQPITFQCLYELNDKKQKILVRFLIENPTKRLVRCLMNCVYSNSTHKGFIIIMTSLHESEEFCEKFVACDGLQFLEKCFRENSLSLDMFAMIISNLVYHRLFIEVDKFISKLDKSHPLFSLSHKQLEDIVYGKNSGRFRPLRVPSLFYLLQDKEHIDSYNSYLLGRFGLKSFLKNGYDIYKVPFIKEISNRYLLSKHVDLMMKQPEHFDEFCDKQNFDHFSLFILYPLQDELHFKGDFNAISFWVRFDHVSNKGINCFFNDENVYLSLEDNSIKIEILSQKSDKMFISTKPNKSISVKTVDKWIHFYITTEEQRKSMKKTVYVNGKNQVSCDIANDQKDSNRSIYFYNYGQQLMYIGPAIRFFSKQITNSSSNFAADIFNHGPGYVNFFSNKFEQNKIINLINIELNNNNKNAKNHPIDEFIITPFNLSRKNMEIWKEVPSNCYTVPYFGFPFHFLSNRRLTDLFKILNSSKDENSFNLILKTLISINSIISIDPDRFFRQFLNSMMTNRQYISKQIFIDTLRSIFGQQPSKFILQSILFDRDMWEKFDPNLLLDALFDDYFKTADFSNIPNYELFLLVIVKKHPKCIGTLMKNIQRFPSLSILLLDTLKYKKKNAEIQVAIASNYAKIIQSSSFINERAVSKQIKKFLVISVKPLAAEIFNLMTVISIKKKEPFQLSNSVILYSVMQLASYQSVWQNIHDLLETFDKTYIFLLLGLIWSYSYGEIFMATFNDKAFNRSNSYDTKYISYLKDNASYLINDKLCTFLLLNFFPILYNITEFEIGPEFEMDEIRSKNMRDFTHSILQCFDVVFTEYYTYKPEVTKQYFRESSLIFLYNTILKECKSESKFKSFYFALFVGCPFYNETLFIEYSPVILISFLSNYTTFPNCSLFLKYLLFIISKKMSIDQLDNILILLFDTCETKYFNIMNTLLFAICTEYSEHDLIFEILEGEIRTFYNIITSQKRELAWFYLLYPKKNILNLLNEFEWTPHLKNILNNLISSDSSSIDFTEMKKQYISLKNLHENELTSVEIDFDDKNKTRESQYKSRDEFFFKDILSQIEASTNDSKQIHDCIKKKKSFLSNSIEFIEEKMHWSHFLSSLINQMSDVSQFDPKLYYLSQKCMPYKCPELFSPLFIKTKEEATQLFSDITSSTKKNSKINLDLFIKSESLIQEKVIVVDCKICRYKYEIPSIMIYHESGISFLTFAEVASENEIQLLDKINSEFITSVLSGQWGLTSIFSRHVVIKVMANDIVFIQFLKYKAFNIWSFKHGQFTVKLDSIKLKQIKYWLSKIATKAMNNLSHYPFLFKIEDYSAAFNKWSKYEISTDDLLLVSNGLSRRSFINLRAYPYFPFKFAENILENNNSSIFKSNISLAENSTNASFSSSFLFSSNISSQSSSNTLFLSSAGSSQVFMTIDQNLYSFLYSSNETAVLLRNVLPFSRMISSDFSQINKDELLSQGMQKAESVSDLQNSISYGNDIASSSTNINDKNETDDENESETIKMDEESIIKSSLELIKPNQTSNKMLSDSSGEEYSTNSSQIIIEPTPTIQTAENSAPTSVRNDSNLIPESIKSSNSSFFSNFLPKFENKPSTPTPSSSYNNSNIGVDERINRTRLTSFSSTNSNSSSPLGISNRKRMKRYSDAPLAFHQNSITVPNQPSILAQTTKATKAQLDSIINIFAEPLLDSYADSIESNDEKDENNGNESNPYRYICPANFFYSPEMIRNISKNAPFCVQRHRESLENVYNSRFIASWIIESIIGDAVTAKMKRIINQRTNQFNNLKHIFSFNLIHVSQKLKKGCKPSKTFMFTSDNKLKRIKRLSKRIIDTYFAVIDKKDLSLSIIDFRNNAKKRANTVVCIRDKFFALSKSICVSSNGLFISVDYEFGVTRVYRIIFDQKGPSSIEFLNDFSSNTSPNSVIDGNRWICATYSLSQLVLWNIFDGTIHRILNFGSSKITAISMDEESGVWIATENKGYFISINGEILSEINLPEEISTINAISIHSSISDRAAACGTVSGKVFLLTPRFDTKTIETKELRGGHSHEIMQIIVNKNLKMFITVDSKNNSVLWTAKGLPCENLNISMFEKCPICNQKPETSCSSCNRKICSKCSINGLCLTCYSLS